MHFLTTKTCENASYNILRFVLHSGGKWTTYRSMAEETVDKALEVCDIEPKRCCQTLGLMLDGAHCWSPTMHIKLVQNFGLDVKVIKFSYPCE